MAAFLLDVNVLVALLWEEAEAHAAAREWFASNARKGWATCPFTQAGFVRIVSNTAMLRHAVRPAQALEVLQENLKHASHEFWHDDLTIIDAVAPFRQQLSGHQQITDAYLLGVAAKHKGRFVTFDKAIAALAEAAGLRHLVTTLAP